MQRFSSQSLPCHHHHVMTSPSTNSELLASIKNGSINRNLPYMLTASTQTAGRGQHGRTWQSPEGNVYLSLYHPLDTPLSGLLSLVVGYHLTQLSTIQKINQGLRQQNLPTIGVKWANDIGFYDPLPNTARANQGVTNKTTNKAGEEVIYKYSAYNKCMFNKLAGILIEPVLEGNRLIGVVVGVGLNVANVPLLNAITAEGMDYQATGVNELLAVSQAHRDFYNRQASEAAAERSINASDLYLPIRNAIGQAIARFNDFSKTTYHCHRFMNEYSKVDVLRTHHVMVNQSPTLPSSPTSSSKDYKKTTKNLVIQGTVSGINEDGSLQIAQDDDKTIDVYSGTITVIG